MLRQLGNRLAPRLTPGTAACLQESSTQCCGVHSCASQWGVGIPERKMADRDISGTQIQMPCAGHALTVPYPGLLDGASDAFVYSYFCDATLKKR